MAKDNNNMSKFPYWLSSCVFAAIIGGMFSLLAGANSNKIAKEIEMMKYEYDLHQETYNELKEALNYFARFQVFDAEFVNHFEYSVDVKGFDYVFEMADVAQEEFGARVRCIVPYLSEEAKDILKINGVLEFELQTYEINLEKVVDVKTATEECRIYFDSINTGYQRFAQKIIEAIEHDIKTKYIPI